MNHETNQHHDQQRPRTRQYVGALAILICLTLFSGVVHGVLDGRWSVPEDLQRVGSRLNELPQQVGDWTLLETSELSEGADELLRCYGSIVRVYENQENRQKINVAVLYGPRGPIAVHTPEVCYDSVGTKQHNARRIESITTPSGRHKLWSVQFTRNQEPTPSLEVWYAWSDGANWQAARHPRFWLTEDLYKIQIAGPVGQDAFQPCRDFLEEFLPQVSRVIE